MTALAIDCCSTYGTARFSVAAKNASGADAPLFARLTLENGEKESDRLISIIDYVMRAVSLSPERIDYTTLTIGPGGYTSLRVALSALKALTLFGNIPIYGVPTLDAYAYPYMHINERVLSVIASRENEYFYRFYDPHSPDPFMQATDMCCAEIGEILSRIGDSERILVAGPHAGIFTDAVRKKKENAFGVFYFFDRQKDSCEALFEIAEKMIAQHIPPLKDYEGPLYGKQFL